MATLTVNIPFKDELLRKVDYFAKDEERSREDVVNEAIDVYLRRKIWDKFFADGGSLNNVTKLREMGFTDEDFTAMMGEEIREMRAERRRGENQ